MALSLRWRLAASVAMGLALIVVLAYSGQILRGLRSLTTVPPWVLVASIGAQSVSYLCRAGRLYAEFGGKGADPGLRYGVLLRTTLLHNASVNVVPMRAGELALPWLLQRYGAIPIARGTATLIWLRVQDAAVLALVALLFWPALSSLERALGAVLLALAGVLTRVVVGRLARFESVRDAESGWRRWLAALIQAAQARWATWAWSAANWIVKLAGVALLLGSVLDVRAAPAWVGAVGGELAALLPVQGTAGFGSYEAAVALALAPARVPFGTALGAAFAVHCVMLAVALLLGGAAWLWLPSGAARGAPLKEYP